MLQFSEGRVVRPFLGTLRAEIETYLKAMGQNWREDSSNRHLTFTRNRIRHELLPLLETWNPRLREHLSQMAKLAQEEEAWWQTELARVAPQVILPGKPVRGGGRSGTDGLAIELIRFAGLPVALQRRVLRYVAQKLGATLDFAATESLRNLSLTGRAGQKRELEGLHAARTARELRLQLGTVRQVAGVALVYHVPIPGEVEAAAFGLRVRIASEGAVGTATLRTWVPGDRVRLRYSGAPRKVKEILARLTVSGSDRAVWPVLEWRGRIVWMKGVELEPQNEFTVQAETLTTASNCTGQ